MRVLITGGAGFIGLHLARRLLADGAQVDLVDDFSRGRRDGELAALGDDRRLVFVERDLIRPEAFAGLDRRYDQIFHLAAIVGVANVERRPFAVLRDNAEMLLRVLDFAAGQAALERLVFLSTSEVHAGSLEHLDLAVPTPEAAPVALPDLARPRSSYLLSKLYGEALCLHAGLPVTIARPYNIYGPRMGLAHVIPELMQRAAEAPEGGRLEVFSAAHCRAFCFVEDAVEMLLRLARAPGTLGGVYNLGNGGEMIAMGALARLVLETLGRELEVVAGATTPGSPARRCPDMTKTLAATGYQPRVDLRQGLARTWNWYERHCFAAPLEQPA